MMKYQCNGTNSCGNRCKLKRKYSDFCKTHEYQNENCTICLNYTKNRITLNCGHFFCKYCIYRWMCANHNCPLCRTPINDHILHSKTLTFGIRNKLLIFIDEVFINTMFLTKDEVDILENCVSLNQIMYEEDWENIKPNINETLLSKLEYTEKKSIVRTADEAEWDYYNKYNKMFILH